MAATDSGVYDSARHLVQIIDENGEFSPMDQLSVALNRWNFLKKGFDYHVVAILGAQSSGKSTLLNLLFGTTFPVMTASEGRTQTTKGVWAGFSSARSEKEETIVVLDVEGTDSRERGEQAASFERKTSLFSLALSEVLIVNMWHNDIGRYNAGNIALLKTVFELNLQLFQKSSGLKTILLFVIRDHIPKETPLEKLKGIVLKDMNTIWEGLTKPAEFTTSKVVDFFEFQFTALPHKVLAEEQFTQDVGTLRNRFVDSKDATYILRPNFRTDIPADGFSPYAQRIWQTIKENKDLDLPSQKEMLAMYRCDEILNENYLIFSQEIAPYKRAVEKGQNIEKFGEKISDLYQKTLADYDLPASRYHAEVASKKRATLASNMNVELFSIFTKLIQKLVERSVSSFTKQLHDKLPSDGTAAKDFASIKSQVEEEALKVFSAQAQEFLLKESDWSFSAELEDLKTLIEKEVQVTRESQLKKLNEEMKTALQSTLGRPLEKTLDDPSDEMWGKIRQLFVSGKQKVSENLQQRLKGFQASESEVSAKIEDFQQTAFTVLKDKVKEKVKYLGFIMTKKFEEKFNQDEQKLPRRWGPSDDIAKVFVEARKSTEQLIEKFSILRLTPELDNLVYLSESDHEPEIDKSLIILTHEEAETIKDKFYKDADSAYKQALRDQETVKTSAHVPMYVIVLLIVLGFNEFITVLTNPILFFLVTLAGVGFYIIRMLNMQGPFMRVIETVLHTSLSGVQAWYSEQMHRYSPPVQGNSRQQPQQQQQEDKKGK